MFIFSPILFVYIGIIYVTGILADMSGRSKWLWMFVVFILMILGPFFIPMPLGLLEGFIMVYLFWFVCNLAQNKDSIFDQLRKRIRIFYLNHTQDPEKIYRIVQNEPYEEVQKKAVTKLRDINYLKNIAQNNSSSKVREEAVKKIRNPKLLKHIIRNDPNENVKKRALNQLDQYHPNDEERIELRDQLFYGEI